MQVTPDQITQAVAIARSMNGATITIGNLVAIIKK